MLLLITKTFPQLALILLLTGKGQWRCKEWAASIPTKSPMKTRKRKSISFQARGPCFCSLYMVANLQIKTEILNVNINWNEVFGVILIIEQYYFCQNIKVGKEETKPWRDIIFMNLYELVNFLERDKCYTDKITKKKTKLYSQWVNIPHLYQKLINSHK